MGEAGSMQELNDKYAKDSGWKVWREETTRIYGTQVQEGGQRKNESYGDCVPGFLLDSSPS
jgi:hypothetical protein